MSTLNDRATLIYEYLTRHLNHGFTMAQLCHNLGLQNSAKTHNAIRRAREMATENGLHFPPAIQTANSWPRYMITDQAVNAVRPTKRMHNIARGVQRREQVGVQYMTDHLADLPEDVQRSIAQQARVREAMAALDDVLDSMVNEMTAHLDDQPAA